MLHKLAQADQRLTWQDKQGVAEKSGGAARGSQMSALQET